MLFYLHYMVNVWRANSTAKGVESETQILHTGKFKNRILVDLSRFKFHFRRFWVWSPIINELNTLLPIHYVSNYICSRLLLCCKESVQSKPCNIITSIFRSQTQFSKWFVILFQIEFVVFMFFPVIASIVTNSRVDVNRGESICLSASLR